MKSVSDYKSLLSYYRSFYPLVLGIEKYRYMHEATNSTSVLLPDEGNQENALEEVIRESQDFDADSPKLVSLQQSIESDANIPVCYVFYSSDEEHEVEEPPAEELNEDIGSLKRLRSFFWACEKNH